MYKQEISPKIQMSILVSLEDRNWIIDQSNKDKVSYSQYIKKLIDKDRKEKENKE